MPQSFSLHGFWNFSFLSYRFLDLFFAETWSRFYFVMHALLCNLGILYLFPLIDMLLCFLSLWRSVILDRYYCLRVTFLMSLACVMACFFISRFVSRPSRRFSLLDSMLSSDTWAQVQGHFGGPSGHSVDLMALPSNVQHASSGHPLPFFSPVPSPGASGVNVFSQLPHHHSFFHNPYAFLPIILLPKLLHFLSCHGITCTLVVPDVHPRKFRWPLLQRFQSARLATRGTQGIVLPLTNSSNSSSHSIESPSSLGLLAALLQIVQLDEITSYKKLHSSNNVHLDT